MGAGSALAQPATYDDDASAAVAEATRLLDQLNKPLDSAGKRKPKAAVEAQKAAPLATPRMAPQVASGCNLNGNPNFFTIGDTGFCGAFHGLFTGFLGKDFAQNDVGFTSQRLPAMRIGNYGQKTLTPAVPMLYYYDNPLVANQTKGVYVGTDSMVNFLAFRNTEYGTLSMFINARIYARTETNYWGENRITVNQIDGNYWRGATDQAWIQFEGLRFGLQPSLFSFSRTGYTYMPGYQSYMTTPAVSYTKRFDNILPAFVNNLGASLSVSAEDSRMRRYSDGVLAYYNYSQYPDFVGQARIGTPSFLLHMSGAMHQIRDVGAYTYTGVYANRTSTWGWAAQIAGEYRWKWSNVLGEAGGNMYGKAMVSVAASQGALAYLGIPYMALDYVSGSYGQLKRSSGQSFLASYEHLWTPVFKTSVTGAAFQTFMGSLPEDLGLMVGMPAMGFQNQVRGQRLAANAEYWLGDGWALGLDGGYTWTRAEGQYTMGGLTTPVLANFPNVLSYMRKAF
jgi:hypothetical protein